ncbi:G-protein alpha subunit [Pelomyxa schiedti]|nr:G-protein alpha subunit [Pelomyxa schiedti]
MGSSGSSNKEPSGWEREAEGSAGKIVLMGCGETGKATFYRHISFLLLNEAPDVPEDARRVYKSSMQFFCAKTACCIAHRTDIDLQPSARAAAEELKPIEPNNLVTSNVFDIQTQVLSVLTDPSVLPFLRNRYEDPETEGKFFANATYYAENCKRILDADYLPTFSDIIRVRIKTTGCSERFLVKDNTKFQLVLLGSQRSERKKWVCVYPGTDVVCYVASLIEYNQKLYEDGVTNRLAESKKVFAALPTNPELQSIPFVLCLNFLDLFLLKKLHHPPCNSQFLLEFQQSHPKLPQLTFLCGGSQIANNEALVMGNFPKGKPLTKLARTTFDSHLKLLPEDIWHQIFSFFDASSLFRLRLVCKSMLFLIDNADSVWMHLVSRALGTNFTVSDLQHFASLIPTSGRLSTYQAAYVVVGKNLDIRLIASYILGDKVGQIPVFVTCMLDSDCVQRLMSILVDLLPKRDTSQPSNS